MQGFTCLWCPVFTDPCRHQPTGSKPMMSEFVTRKEHIMLNILKKQNGMTIIGQGGKIIFFTLPSLIAAILIDVYSPQMAALPDGLRFLQPVGYLLLVPGLVLWATAIIQLLTSFSKGKLVTTALSAIPSIPVRRFSSFPRSR
jgi:hypothetical protein